MRGCVNLWYNLRMKKSMRKLADELARLRSVLRYERKTGNFIWRVHRTCYGGCVRTGDIAGTTVLDKDGGYHINIGVDSKIYRAHRLAYFL